MSNRQPGMSGVTFEPTPERLPVTGHEAMLFFGVIYPALVIALELVSRLCAETFFDPMPTYWHTLAVSLVPASNALVVKHLRDGAPGDARWLAFANGAAIAIAAVYTLLFLPLMPLAVVAIIIVVGVLPFAPLASFVIALKLRSKLSRSHRDERLLRPLLAGLTAGVALLLALDIPAAATRLGMHWATSSVPSERERGLTLLRTIGDDDLLLRLCYGALGRPSGLLSAFVMFGTGHGLMPARQHVALSPAEAREIYYRVHGVPFNTKPAPFRSNSTLARLADFQFDEDHGGTQVGGRLNGLHMVSSRIDGSISGDDVVAYLEWTVEFRNSAALAREARLQLALPPGGVVSRATLWINGEEREAAYGGRGEVRAAYQRVAVQQRRDPLLVTTKGADRVLAQAFPVPANGGTIKFKIGITAPLELIDASKARLTLPALVDRNFSFPADTRHGVWIEGKQALTAMVPGLTSNRVDTELFRISGSVGERDLSGTRQTITVDRNPNTGKLVARIGDGEPVVQEVARGAPTAGALMLVVDGSARLADKATQLIKALDIVPPTAKVGVIIASEPMQRIAIAPWSDVHKRNVVRLLRAASFGGGQDNAPAIADALQLLEAEPGSTLVWIHGPQPVAFRDSAARLEQASTRLKRLPQVALYSVEPGPNEVLPDMAWAWGARSLPHTGSVSADLSGFLAHATGVAQTHVIRRMQGEATDGLAKGSDHIVRLWANDRVLQMMADPAHTRGEAVALATQYRLVTPVSGAVVLETQRQYDESRLTPVSQATVPTIPEPHEWALLIIVCGGLIWLAWRNRQRIAFA